MVNHDCVKNSNPPDAEDDLIAAETPEKNAEELNSVEENKTSADESEQAPPTSVTKVTVCCCLIVCRKSQFCV